MSVEGVSGPKDSFQGPLRASSPINWSPVKEAYSQAAQNPSENHAEVGVLSANGTSHFERLGKNEEYGAHRVGSVSKTFTVFLALKLIHSGVLPKGLQTRLGDIVVSSDLLQQLFANPKIAAEMTLDQLLSHTAGMEIDDHSQMQKTQAPNLNERFLQEAKEGRKYTHTSRPGDRIGSYSNAGVAVACWMMELAYNQKSGRQPIPFSEIMKRELFQEVFHLTDSFLGPGPTGDIIQSGAGDMTSSVSDLMKVASRLQQGEHTLERFFGKDWQAVMLAPRDLLQQRGLGCTPNKPYIQHAGMNREIVGTEEKDVTALVVFPRQPHQGGVVALCDSGALGPGAAGQHFIHTLKEAAGISEVEEKPTQYQGDFFIPDAPHFLFHGNAFLISNVDPFTNPQTIACSRNGMRHTLVRDNKLDQREVSGYRDQYGKPWIVISREDGRKSILSDHCLLIERVEGRSMASQPDRSYIQSLKGVYENVENPHEHPRYFFTEKNGHLYMRDLNDSDRNDYACLYVPDEKGNSGIWVMSNPNERPIQIRFPKNPDADYLVITDILTGNPQKPLESKRI
jgi:CubicO group peptidase (beta-lactamase class C family)